MNKKITIALILMLSFVLTIPVQGAERYSDLPTTHWAYESIENFSQSGLISGYPDGTFGPDKEITYGEFIKLIYVAMSGKTLVQDKEYWSLNYYNELMSLGIFSLADVGLNDLDKVIPRLDMALMLGNILKINDIVTDEIGFIDNRFSDTNRYTDHIEEITHCTNTGLINGFPDGSFRPYSGLTRAQAVAVISRLINLIPDPNLEKYEFIGIETVKNRDFKVTNYKAQVGFRGIDRIEYDEQMGLISVYSLDEENISLFIDGYMAEPVINAEGDTFDDKGCKIFYFLAGDYYKQDSKLGVSLDENIEEVFYFN